MLGAVVAGVTFPFRLGAARMSPRARVFDLCPLFCAIVLVGVVVAEIGSSPAAGTAPHIALFWRPYQMIMIGFLLAFAVAVRPRTAWDWMSAISAALALPLAYTIMPFALEPTIGLFPNVQDANVVALDATWGGQLSFLVADIFVRYPSFANLCWIFYQTLLLPVALVAVMEAHRVRRLGLGVVPTFLVIAAIGYVFYCLMPVVGPAPHFGDAFPLPTARAHTPQPRNCMPSLHTAWILMALLATRGMSRSIQLLVSVWLVAVLIATLGSGEHYLTDLVVACPFLLLVRVICASDVPWSATERREALLVGLAFMMVWVLAVRGAINLPMVPGLAPGFMVATVVISLWWERKLARAAGFVTGAGSSWAGFTRRRVAASAAPLSV